MATTINEITSHAGDGLNFLHLKLTAGGADTTITYTVPGAPYLKFVGLPVKTTGTQAGVGAAYVESTGVLTIGPVVAADVIRITIGF